MAPMGDIASYVYKQAAVREATTPTGIDRSKIIIIIIILRAR
jgi:hypothetical protein